MQRLGIRSERIMSNIRVQINQNAMLDSNLVIVGQYFKKETTVFVTFQYFDVEKIF